MAIEQRKQTSLDAVLKTGHHPDVNTDQDDKRYGAVAPSAGERAGVMRCSECGHLVPDSLYCLNCGAPLLVKEMKEGAI